MISSHFKFLRRVRIHDGECGAVARALHHKVKIHSLPAAIEKASTATQERKVMSKKTFFKRIAVTAIAALGFGMLSVAPSQATVTSHTLTIDSATDSIETSDTATAVLTSNFVNLGSAYDSVMVFGAVTSSNAEYAGTMTFTVTDSYTSSGNTALAANSPIYGYGDAVGGAVTGDALAATVFSGTSGASGTIRTTTRDSITIGARSSTVENHGSVITVHMYNMSRAGTYTVSFFTKVSNDGAAPVSSAVGATWTITVADPTRTAAASSTVTLRKGNVSAALGTYFGGTAEGTDSQTIAAASATTTSATPEFQLIVKQKSAISTNTAKESYTVQVTGNAWVTRGTNDTGAYAAGTRGASSAGTKFIQQSTPTADSATIINVWSNGTAGTATITVTTASGLVLGTKTVTFYDDVAALAVNTTTYQRKIVRAGGFTSGTMFWVKATDANGNVVQDVDPSIVSSDVSVITGGSCTDASSGVSDGLSACTVTSAAGSTSGSTATLTIRTLDPARAAGTTSYLTATYEVTLGGSVASEVITLDKTSYSPGEWMVVTVTAKDSAGNAVYDGASAPTLTANKALSGSISMTSYIGGVATSAARSATTDLVTNDQNLGAPTGSGSFIVGGLSGATGTPYISVTGTVGDDAATTAAAAASDAALEAIDAANAATDAANLAAEAADAATVAAEEARDAADAATAAVEALASEVATLMAALKAQITTLAKTVAKIAKKVKA